MQSSAKPSQPTRRRPRAYQRTAPPTAGDFYAQAVLPASGFGLGIRRSVAWRWRRCIWRWSIAGTETSRGCSRGAGEKTRMTDDRKEKARQRNLWVTDTSNGAGKVRSRRPANPLLVVRRLFLVASWISNQFERAGKRCAVREDHSYNPSVRTPLVKLGELEYTPS